MCHELLSKPENSVLIFVYQTTSAVRSAQALSSELGLLTGEAGALAYHSKMPKLMREKARGAYLVGTSRCLVCTSALAAGLNLPASHVIVRDLTFAGVGPLHIEDLIQMSGRAGRGIRPGHAFFIHRPSDAWRLDELVENLEHPHLRSLTSALVPPIGGQKAARTRGEDTVISASATMLLSLLARAGEAGRTLSELKSFVGKTLGGKLIVPHVRQALDWLRAPDRLFTWLLNALAGICDLRCFYHHLRSECGASENRVLHVKRLIQRLRILAYQTASQLRYCSLLVEFRRSQGLKGVGEKTIQRLEAIGATTFPALAQMTDEQLIAAGISRNIGDRLRAYVRRRIR